MATRPTTAPTDMPTAEGLPFIIQSRSIQLTAAAAAAKFVVTRAKTANSFAARALPPLKPNQPNHNRPAPRITKGMFVGLNSPALSFLAAFMWSFHGIPQSFLLPITSAAARADRPADTWTTRPPAKSIAPKACSHPSGFHTQ